MNIKRSIRIAAAMQDLNQEQVAERTGINKATISQLINGKTNCTQATLEKLLKGFGLSASEFFKLGE